MRVVWRLLACLWTCGAGAAELWYVPKTATLAGPGPLDAAAFWTGAAAWTLSGVSPDVVQLDTTSIDPIDDATLARWLSVIADHRARAAIGVQPVAFQPGCGHVEGYDDPRHIVAVAARLTRLRAAVTAIELDGAFLFGHVLADPGYCQLDIAATARETARNIRALLDAFPDAAIEDTEGPPALRAGGTEAAYAAFLAAFEQETGRKIRSLRLDVPWRNPHAAEAVHAALAFARAHGLRGGIIYNGDDQDATDAAWMAHARDNIDATEAAGDVPDEALFASWDVFPRLLLPTNSPDAMGALLDFYTRTPSALALRRDGRAVTGTLTAQGQPVAFARVEVASRGVFGPPPAWTRAGRAPAGTASALIGWRFNTECRCAAAMDAVLGDLALATPGGILHGHAPGPANPAWPGTVRATLREDETLLFNSAPIRVAAGDVWTLRARAGGVDGAALPGYATVIFLDARGQGLTRETIPIGPALHDMRTAMTDARGVFRARADGAVALRYPGDAQRRGVTATLPAATPR